MFIKILRSYFKLVLVQAKILVVKIDRVYVAPPTNAQSFTFCVDSLGKLSGTWAIKIHQHVGKRCSWPNCDLLELCAAAIAENPRSAIAFPVGKTIKNNTKNAHAFISASNHKML